MLDIILIYIGIPFLFALIIYFTLAFVKAGYFNAIQVSVIEKPPILSQNITIFYKYCLGPYTNASKTLKDVVGILPHESTSLLGIFYDDPQVVKSDKCQAAVGCIYEVDGKPLFEENFAIQLTRWGFEKMVLHKVERAVYCKQQYSNVISNLHLSKIRSKFIQFAKEKRLEVGCSVEIYKKTADGTSFVEMFKPLDHAEDFYVPEYLTNDQLEALMARKKFDSEESASESELEDIEDEDEDGITSASQLDDDDEEEEGGSEPGVKV